MIYLYNKENSPNLDILESGILSSNSYIADTYIYLRWDFEDKKLKIILNRELDLEEKIMLDALIESL